MFTIFLQQEVQNQLLGQGCVLKQGVAANSFAHLLETITRKSLALTQNISLQAISGFDQNSNPLNIAHLASDVPGKENNLVTNFFSHNARFVSGAPKPTWIVLLNTGKGQINEPATGNKKNQVILNSATIDSSLVKEYSTNALNLSQAIQENEPNSQPVLPQPIQDLLVEINQISAIPIPQFGSTEIFLPQQLMLYGENLPTSSPTDSHLYNTWKIIFTRNADETFSLMQTPGAQGQEILSGVQLRRNPLFTQTGNNPDRTEVLEPNPAVSGKSPVLQETGQGVLTTNSNPGSILFFKGDILMAQITGEWQPAVEPDTHPTMQISSRNMGSSKSPELKTMQSVQPIQLKDTTSNGFSARWEVFYSDQGETAGAINLKKENSDSGPLFTGIPGKQFQSAKNSGPVAVKSPLHQTEGAFTQEPAITVFSQKSSMRQNSNSSTRLSHSPSSEKYVTLEPAIKEPSLKQPRWSSSDSLRQILVRVTNILTELPNAQPTGNLARFEISESKNFAESPIFHSSTTDDQAIRTSQTRFKEIPGNFMRERQDSHTGKNIPSPMVQRKLPGDGGHARFMNFFPVETDREGIKTPFQMRESSPISSPDSGSEMTPNGTRNVQTEQAKNAGEAKPLAPKNRPTVVELQPNSESLERSSLVTKEALASGNSQFIHHTATSSTGSQMPINEADLSSQLTNKILINIQKQIEQWVRAIQFQPRTQQIVVQLQPETLGKLRIHLKLENDLLTGRIETEHKETFHALSQHQPHLLTRLKEAGIPVQHFEMSFHSPSENAAGTSQFHQNRNRSHNSLAEGRLAMHHSELVEEEQRTRVFDRIDYHIINVIA